MISQSSSLFFFQNGICFAIDTYVSTEIVIKSTLSDIESFVWMLIFTSYDCTEQINLLKENGHVAVLRKHFRISLDCTCTVQNSDSFRSLS